MLSMRRAVVALCLLSLVFALPAFAQEPAAKLEVLSHLPKDALFVWAGEPGSLAAELDEVLSLIQRFVPADGDESMNLVAMVEKADETLGVSLRNDLLARIGPEMAVVVDLPPIDSLMGLAMSQTPEMIDQSFANVGIVFQVRDPQAFEKSLRTALTSLGVEPVETDGMMKLAAPKTSEEAPEVAAYLQVKDGWMTLGAGPSWTRSAVAPRAKAERFTAGGDFRRVMGHLDANTTSVFYMNLPKLGQLVKSSGVVQGALSGKPELAEAVNWLIDEELTMGWAQTKVEMDGGVRLTTFGPEILSGGASMAIAAAMVMAGVQEQMAAAGDMDMEVESGEDGGDMEMDDGEMGEMDDMDDEMDVEVEEEGRR